MLEKSHYKKILDFYLFYFTIIIMVDTNRTKLEQEIKQTNNHH
jgi:hypothetical protein